MNDDRRDILFQDGFRAGVIWSAQIARLSAARIRLLPKSDEPEVFGNRMRLASSLVLDDLASALEGVIGTPPGSSPPTAPVPPSPRPPVMRSPVGARTVGALALAIGDEDARSIALAKGYTGDECHDCGSFSMVRNGTCLKCENCGSTTGCS